MSASGTAYCMSPYRLLRATTRVRSSSRRATCIARTGACPSASPRTDQTGWSWCCPERLLLDVAVVLLDRGVDRVGVDAAPPVRDVEGQRDTGQTGQNQDVADHLQIDGVPR